MSNLNLLPHKATQILLLAMRTIILKELRSTNIPNRVESTKKMTYFMYDGGNRHKEVIIIQSSCNNDCKDSMNQV